MIETDSYGSLKMAVNEINDRQDKDQNILVRKATAKPIHGKEGKATEKPKSRSLAMHPRGKYHRITLILTLR